MATKRIEDVKIKYWPEEIRSYIDADNVYVNDSRVMIGGKLTFDGGVMTLIYAINCSNERFDLKQQITKDQWECYKELVTYEHAAKQSEIVVIRYWPKAIADALNLNGLPNNSQLVYYRHQVMLKTPSTFQLGQEWVSSVKWMYYRHLVSEPKMLKGMIGAFKSSSGGEEKEIGSCVEIDKDRLIQQFHRRLTYEYCQALVGDSVRFFNIDEMVLATADKFADLLKVIKDSGGIEHIGLARVYDVMIPSGLSSYSIRGGLDRDCLEKIYHFSKII